MHSVTLSSKGQLVIPKPLRDRVNLSLGDTLSVRVVAGEIRLRPLTRVQPDAQNTLEVVAGCLALKGGKKLSDAQTRQAIMQRLKSRDDASR
jgi:AbrB family looped-hinge helix DNA binding protein